MRKMKKNSPVQKVKIKAKPKAKSKTTAKPTPAKVKTTKPPINKTKPKIEAPALHTPTQAPTMESVKKELFLQRGAFKGAVTRQTADVKKKRFETTPSPTPPKKKFESQQTTPMKSSGLGTKKNAPVATIQKPAGVVSELLAETAVAPKLKQVYLPSIIGVKDLADRFSLRPSELIQKLIKLGIFATINQSVNFETASKIAVELNIELHEQALPKETVDEKIVQKQNKSALVARAPIVTFMGHVDHGKTSLLDAIRKTKVVATEAGGITQHIGAYEVFSKKGAITFLDTPGHEAFTAMRARGAKVTDVVVLVVAADDGVMPQTIEAIDHATAANVPIIVAINKIDLPSIDIDRAKKALMEHGLTPEDWGGKTVMIGVSAKTGAGIDQLLEMLALESELLELRADPSNRASGVVVEAELSQGSGVLATLLIQDGTLHVGDTIVVGEYYCRVRAMINDRGQRVKEALPSMPVEILGLPAVPKAGDRFLVVENEQKAKLLAETQAAKLAARLLGSASHLHLEELYEGIKAGRVEELKLVIKSDVQGSVEALRQTLDKIEAKNVRLSIIHSGVGDITESDVMLATASDAVIIGFHVGIAGVAKQIAEKEQVDIRFYDIIYEVKTAIEKAMEGLLEPEMKEIFLGTAEVRQVFKVSKIGTIAGCVVQKGKILRNASCRVMRDGKKVHQGKVTSLKRFKDDAREVLEGYECGIGVSQFDEMLSGDRIEVFELQKLARKLE